MCSYHLLSTVAKWLALSQNLVAPFPECGIIAKGQLLSWNYISQLSLHPGGGHMTSSH